MLLFSTTEPHACPTINPSQSVLSEGSSYYAHWCSQLLPQSITHTGWPVHGRKCGVYYTMQLGANCHPCGEPHLESACAVSTGGGTASAGNRASIGLEILLGIPIPPSEAVAVAQACLPSGPVGGLLQTALVDGLQASIAARVSSLIGGGG